MKSILFYLLRFCEEQQDALTALTLVPSLFAHSTLDASSLKFYEDDLPAPEDLDAELHMWKVH